MFDRRPLLVFSLGAFAVFSLVTGFATNAMYLDIMIGMLGLWSAGAVPPAVGALGAAYQYPSKRKNRAFACFAAGNPLGAVMGTIFSGIAAHLFSWRASFFLMAIMYLVFFVSSIFTTPKTQASSEPLSWDVLEKFDLVGVFLSMAGLALFTSSLR
jgi:predicted MFS family arabinose efflux permease